jgi:site-specific recombinase XerD
VSQIPALDARQSAIVTASAPEILAAIDAAAAHHVNEQRPANTATAYAADWKVWQTFTARLGIPDTSTSDGLFVAFVEYLERAGVAPTTIDRRLAGVVVTLRDKKVEPSRKSIKDARTALNGCRRRLAEAGEQRGRGNAPAMTVKQLRDMCLPRANDDKRPPAFPDTLTGHRDRAIVLMAFAIAGRRSEVANLLVTDIVESDEGLTVTVRFGKTGARTVAVPYGSTPATCPVRAWRAWLAASGITDGAAFRRIDRHGRILDGLKPQSIGTVITKAGEHAGVEVHLTGHSARRGLATEARRAGHDETAVAAQGGWVKGSRALGGYFEVVDRWTDNAVAGIGL